MINVEWIDGEREPQCAPDPNYPNGKQLDISVPGEKACGVELPYPAKRCGVYIVKCSVCGMSVGITTAGRPDDPCRARIPCKQTLQ